MKQIPLMQNPWVRKGLSVALVLTMLSSGLLFVHSASKPGWEQIMATRFNFFALALAFLALIASWYAEGLRIYWIAKALGETVPFRKIMSINFVTAFAGNVTPFNSGGIPAQIYLLHQSGLQPGKASAVVTIRTIISTLLFTLCAPFMMALFYKSTPTGLLHQVSALAIPLSALLSIVLIALIIRPKLAQHLVSALLKPFIATRIGAKIEPAVNRFLEELDVFNHSIKAFRNGVYLYLVIFCTIAYWFSFFAMAPFLMIAFGVRRPGLILNTIVIQFVLWFLISYLPIPGGCGAIDLSLYSVFVFIPPQPKAFIIICWRFLSYFVSTLVGGVIFLRLINKSSPSTPTAN